MINLSAVKMKFQYFQKEELLNVKVFLNKDSKYNDNTKEWFLINSEWLKDWKMFVNNKRTATACGSRKSNKKDVGILDPGPITNYQLFDDDKRPLEELQKGKHYRGVNREVWQQLYNTYGGGPVIHKNELSIYSPDYKDPIPDDTSEVNSDVIKNYFNKNAEEDEADVGQEHEENENSLQALRSLKTNAFSNSKSKGVSTSKNAKSKLESFKTMKYGSKVRNEKGSSIPRRNLFKKKMPKYGVVHHQDRSPFQDDSKNKGIYKSLLERPEQFDEIKDERYENARDRFKLKNDIEDSKDHDLVKYPKSKIFIVKLIRLKRYIGQEQRRL
jgi:hypothetical protein